MNTKLRVLLVVEPGMDGVFRHVEGLTSYLWEQRQEVHLAYSTRRGSASLEKLVESIQSRGGQCMDLKVGNAPEMGDVRAVWQLRAFAKRLLPDVIHAHSSKAGVLGRALKMTGIRAECFYTPHAYYGLAPRSGFRVHFYNLVERIFGKIGITINVSKDEAKFGRQTLGINENQVRTIPNPVDSSVFKPAGKETKAALRRKLGLPETAIVLGTIGRLSFQKDPETLYRALAPVLAQHSDLILCHVGQGELDGELRRTAAELGIADRIVRPLYLDEPAVFYQVFDALVMTSRYEGGWPMVMLEALASGLPIIVSDAPGISDMGSAGLSHCWQAKTGDVADFTRALEAWRADRPMGRANNHREIAMQQFSVERCHGAVLEEYRKAVRQHSALLRTCS